MKKNSKNITALTLLLAASLLMSACNSSSLESTKTGEKESEETTEETEREETDATKEAEKDESEKTEATTEESEVTTSVSKGTGSSFKVRIFSFQPIWA